MIFTLSKAPRVSNREELHESPRAIRLFARDEHCTFEERIKLVIELGVCFRAGHVGVCAVWFDLSLNHHSTRPHLTSLNQCPVFVLRIGV